MKRPLSSIGIWTRNFSSSSCRRDHYATLGLPHTATKAQIKSHFYKLSKTCHPDVSQDPKAAEQFSKVSEAYTVLSDDRDRSNIPLHPRTPMARARSATYAWESRRRAAPGTHPNSHPHTHTHPHPSGLGTGGHYDPTRPPSASHYASHPRDSYASMRRNEFPSSFGSGSGRTAGAGAKPHLYHDVLTGSRMREEEKAREMDRFNRESMMWRALRLWLAMALGVGAVYEFAGPRYM
ncbi:DnaJ domain-containing protein [Cyathus striatus]|nr:DnaJ domain-containing protein [Cyathus striatus]